MSTARPIRRRPSTRLAALLVTTLLVALIGCSATGDNRLAVQRERGAQAINAQDPATLRDGGTLRIPLDNLPVNYNYLHTDGHEGQTHEVLWALMPRAFDNAPDGGQRLNTDYVTEAEQVSTAPQVIRYRIHPRATWSNGRPLTWEDFAAQAAASSGANPAYQVADTTGYEDIEKVERGSDDKEVLVTFRKPFAEWDSLFYGIYPKEMTSDPAEFNGWLTEPKITAGPFRVENIDLTAKTITLVRDERWWGARPKLDRLIWTVTDRSALADRLANNEIDVYEIGSDVDLYRRALTIPGVEIRQATPQQYSHITFNGAPGKILADRRLRQAIAQGIDRVALTKRLIGSIVPDAAPMGSHIFPFGSKGYRDNSGILPYDPAAASRQLDELGWVRPEPNATRVKDGQELRLRYIVPAGNPISEQVAKTVLEQLAQLGVKVDIEAVPVAGFFSDFINVGNFDLTSFQWITTSAPLSASKAIYQDPNGPSGLGSNFGRIHNPEISAKFAQGLAELDPAKRMEIADEIDKLIWQEVHHLPLYPATGAFAVRATVANYGAKGLGDWDYVRVGFMR